MPVSPGPFESEKKVSTGYEGDEGRGHGTPESEYRTVLGYTHGQGLHGSSLPQ
jgi:hypothetical protein